MGPDATGTEGKESNDVCKITAVAPGVAAPIVSPLRVIVNDAVAMMTAPNVVKTTDDELVEPHKMRRLGLIPEPAAKTTGVTEDAKKPVG